MDLAAAFAKYEPVVRGPRCLLCSLIDTLPENEAKALGVALADTSMPSSAIRKVLVAEGLPASISSISRHRRRECKGA